METGWIDSVMSNNVYFRLILSLSQRFRKVTYYTQENTPFSSVVITKRLFCYTDYK